MKKEPVFLGVYSRQKPDGKKDGGGHWHVWGLEDGKFLVQRKAEGDAPAAEPETVDAGRFFEEFRVHAAFSSQNKPQMPKQNKGGARASKTVALDAEKPERTRVEYHAAGVYPSMQATMVVDEGDDPFSHWESPNDLWSSLNTSVKDGQAEEETAQTRDATYFKDKAGQKGSGANFTEDPIGTGLGKVEQQLRSEFSIALIRLQTNRSQALESLEKILEHSAPFRAEQKHMFSDFGTSLRRRRLYAMAARFHQRAKNLAPDDEHILFNLARALYDGGKIDQAALYLREAVAMSGDFQAGSDFLDFIEEKHRL